MSYIFTLHALILVVAAIAAVTDYRTGKIPNALTLPALVLGPFLYLVWVSPIAALWSVVAAVVCGLPSYMMFKEGGIGGGDVKVFAALGGLGGIHLGIQMQIYAFVAAIALVVICEALSGRALALATNLGRMMLNPLLPRARRRPIQPTQLHAFRLGPAIFVGAALAISQAHALG